MFLFAILFRSASLPIWHFSRVKIQAERFLWMQTHLTNFPDVCIHRQYIHSELLGGWVFSPYPHPIVIFVHVLSSLQRVKGWIALKTREIYCSCVIYCKCEWKEECVIFLYFRCRKLLSDSPLDSQVRDSSIGKLMSFQPKFSLETLHLHWRWLLREIVSENDCYHGNIPERRFISFCLF